MLFRFEEHIDILGTLVNEGIVDGFTAQCSPESFNRIVVLAIHPLFKFL